MSTSRPNRHQVADSPAVHRHLASVISLVLFGLVAGCGTKAAFENAKPSSPAVEPGFEEQLAQVRSETSSSIHLAVIPVTDTEVQELSGLVGLETLIFDAGSITDAGIASIAACRSLEHLRLRESPISDAGIEQLAHGACAQLRILNLPQARVTAVGAGHLSSLKNLKQLRIGGAQIDDSAVAELSKHPVLESLHLIGPKLTDKALESLASMPQLGSLYIDECPLSDSAWLQFFAARPNMHVHIDQHHHDRDPNKHAE